MTKELLEGYRSKKAEIAELHNALLRLGEGDSMIGNDTILDYKSGYPVPQAVIGVDWDKVDRTEKSYQNKIDALENECQEVEKFVDDITDSLTRRIFRMYYINGLSQKKIGHIIHMERSSVSKKINDYLRIKCK